MRRVNPLMRRRVCSALPAFVLLAAASVSCVARKPAGTGGFRPHNDEAVKPVVAVIDFENKASFAGQWKLGAGMADLLVSQLVGSERVVVLERQHLGDVVGEIVRQGQDLFRSEGRAQRGRLKNAQYLVRGAVTDFTVTGDASGWFGNETASVRGRGQRARVALAVRVSDVASGEVICSAKAEGSSSSGWLGAAINYKGLSFGGDAFFRTPLGKATETALRRAVNKILHDLPQQVWQARVAEVVDGRILLNGGRAVGVRNEMRFAVRGAPREITDPVTGNVIEVLPGRVSGLIRVVEVKDSVAYAELLEGAAKRGDTLEPVE